ncbi:MAG: hypothetical protein JNM76_01190 [Betaproteobacteria bacterium]|nr:hypothetical protein [Betaproteobacteria bacterium]
MIIDESSAVYRTISDEVSSARRKSVKLADQWQLALEEASSSRSRNVNRGGDASESDRRDNAPDFPEAGGDRTHDRQSRCGEASHGSKRAFLRADPEPISDCATAGLIYDARSPMGSNLPNQNVPGEPTLPDDHCRIGLSPMHGSSAHLGSRQARSYVGHATKHQFNQANLNVFALPISDAVQQPSKQLNLLFALSLPGSNSPGQAGDDALKDSDLTDSPIRAQVFDAYDISSVQPPIELDGLDASGVVSASDSQCDNDDFTSQEMGGSDLHGEARINAAGRAGTGDAAPRRTSLYAEWTGVEARLWLGMQQRAGISDLQVSALISDLQRTLWSRGERLGQVVVNGKLVYASREGASQRSEAQVATCEEVVY